LLQLLIESVHVHRRPRLKGRLGTKLLLLELLLLELLLLMHLLLL
jgi:hypothetical protein